jgi:enoyl-CoA hydratase/carnithine racemase
MNKLVKLEIKDNIGFIKLNNPPVNVLDKKLLYELEEVLSHVEFDKNIKVLLITGEGKAFCAGADIKSMPELKYESGNNLALRGQEIFNKLENLNKVSICAVNGVAFGGGLELALSTDIRIFADNIKVGLPEINLGIMPGYGGTQRLSRLVGKAKAKEIILTGEPITAQESYDIGLCNKVVSIDDLMNESFVLASKIASKGQIAVKNIKKAINEGLEKSLEEALKIEAHYFGLLCETEDKNEGILAFIEKRKPNFKDS